VSRVRRILLIAVVVLLGSLGVVAVAIAAGGVAPVIGGAPAPVQQAATLTYTPATGATGTDPTRPARVSVVDGTLDTVTLTGPKGPVAGTLAADKKAWASTDKLAYGVTYTWGGTAKAVDGTAVPLAGTFATRPPSKKIRGTLNIGDGRTVGVAAPIRIQFNGHVADRAAAEQALSVETSVPVEGAWGWMPDEGGGSRVDWRPKVYWPAHTKVTVTAKLGGVPYGGDTVGAADFSSSFAIGDAQVVKADVNSFRMVVLRNGQKVLDVPASYGLGSDPERNTRSGVHVVSEKFTDKRMVSERYGYDLVEKWAVRISNNGEFIHANPASTAAQGSANVTHGCVNLSSDNAKAYYDMAQYGDPVEVTGTPVPLAARDGDIWDWTLSWEQWKKLSALS
jgi:lipoprotein-anchoring transpeptidase ErfK/SrfK